MIQLRRVYEPAGKQDGKRFLIERLWPRGIKRTALKMDAWIQDAGPTSALRIWFGHDPEKWDKFRRRYFAELAAKPDVWQPIAKADEEGAVTLLYSSHDTEHNNAVALKQFLEAKLSGGAKRRRRSRAA